jgi:hypothetical protein
MLSGLVLLLAPCTWHLAPALAQQGQPLSALNPKYANRVAAGYSPTAGTGLTLNLSSGTALCGSPPAPVTYAGGTLTLTAAATNYVYLDPLGSCAPALNTSGFGVGQIPIAVVATNGSGITTVIDQRSWFSPPISMDSSGRSIFKGLNGTYFADQFGDKSTTGIASAISACRTSTPCRVVVPGSYPLTESVPGSYVAGYASTFNPGTTSSNVQVQDYRQGDRQTAMNQQGGGANDRAWHEWVDNLFTGPPAGSRTQRHTNLSLVMNAMDGGSLIANHSVGYFRKSPFAALQVVINDYTPSSSGNMFIHNKYSVGDGVPIFGETNFYGGQSTGGEEGAEVADLWLMQGNVAYQARIASGGSKGATSLTLSPTAGSGTQGAGRYLINTTSGKTISAGTITAIANNGGGTPITFAGTGTNWPVSTVNTRTTQAITAPGLQTVTLASTRGITTSTVLVVCDANTYETAIPNAVGSDSITANFYAPHSSGAIVAAGGLAGYFLELTADTVPAAKTGGTDLRQAFPVLYSTSATSLVVSINSAGAWSSFGTIASTQWNSGSGTTGYVLYPGAQVLSVYANGAVGNTFTLMPNAVAWANGDAVELPQHPANGGRLGSWNIRSWWPAFGLVGPQISFMGVPGQGANGVTVNNSAPSTLYNLGGGNLAQPLSAYRIFGPWQRGLNFSGYGPGAVGLYMAGQRWGTTGFVYPIVVTPSSGSSDNLNYNNGTKNWALTVNSQASSYGFGANVSGGGFTIPGHVGSLSPDTQGSVTISRGTSATVTFSVAFQHPPICTLTPTSDPTSVGSYWVASTASSFMVNVHTPGRITFNYICMANPN